MTWLITAWGWFAGTKVGRFLIGVGAVAAALALFAWAMFRKGKHAQAATDEAKNAAEQVQQAQVAQATYQDANEAAQQVRRDAAKQSAPDTVKRDDFNTSF